MKSNFRNRLLETMRLRKEGSLKRLECFLVENPDVAGFLGERAEAVLGRAS